MNAPLPASHPPDAVPGVDGIGLVMPTDVAADGCQLPPPPEPRTLAEAGLTAADVETLVLKTLLNDGRSTGSDVAQRLCLPRTLVVDGLERLRTELLVAIKRAAGLQDFLYELSDAGFARARRLAARSRYVGAAPVPLASYRQAMHRQAAAQANITIDSVARAMSDLVVSSRRLSQLAQAVRAGRGLFLFGQPGNGKTAIAQRLGNVFGQCIWIPRAVASGGDLVRVYDASVHEAVAVSTPSNASYDRRWVLVRRPQVMAGGELTLDQLDMHYHQATGLNEAPLHLKANGGTLVIDDFGRQRASSHELLNRLIVPLERRVDYLHLASGRQIEVPFDVLLVLATNLEPRQLVDEAFLRRIPYKVNVVDPTEEEFRTLLAQWAEREQLHVEPGVLDHLLEEHYRAAGRPLRFCHPRDLLQQVANYCAVHDLPPAVSRENLDLAVENYFAGL